jgi:hypothetical protein
VARHAEIVADCVAAAVTQDFCSAQLGRARDESVTAAAGLNAALATRLSARRRVADVAAAAREIAVVEVELGMIALRLTDNRAVCDTLRLTCSPGLFLPFARRRLITSVRVVRHAGCGAKSVPADRRALRYHTARQLPVRTHRGGSS